jgi:hypothetical protein
MDVQSYVSVFLFQPEISNIAALATGTPRLPYLS